jgi:hypothetical protein
MTISDGLEAVAAFLIAYVVSSLLCYLFARRDDGST